jgi:hypothetical protein
MNPAILGALIGAIPGTIAATLTTWTSVRVSNASQAQTALALTSEHAKWLREKRSEVYVDLLTQVTNAEVGWNTLSETKGKEITEDLKERLLKVNRARGSTAEIANLAARAGSYTATSTSYTFINMINLDTDIWAEARKMLDSGDEHFFASPDMIGWIAEAQIYVTRLNEMAVSDLQTLSISYTPPRLYEGSLFSIATWERFIRQRNSRNNRKSQGEG